MSALSGIWAKSWKNISDWRKFLWNLLKTFYPLKHYLDMGNPLGRGGKSHRTENLWCGSSVQTPNKSKGRKRGLLAWDQHLANQLLRKLLLESVRVRFRLSWLTQFWIKSSCHWHQSGQSLSICLLQCISRQTGISRICFWELSPLPALLCPPLPLKLRTS